MITTIISYVLAISVIIGSIVGGVIYIRSGKKRQAPHIKFQCRMDEISVINNGTSMDDKDIYAVKTDDLGL